MALFELEHVSFERGGALLVDDASVVIEEGTVTALLGKSGSGKSALLKLIAGIYVPTGGRALYNGKNIALMSRADNHEFRRNCSFVFQDSALWSNQSIADNLLLPLKIHYPEKSAVTAMKEVLDICTQVGYTRMLNLRPADLSMGEQKRIAFARALICRPKVLFLDECTESLDRSGTDTMVKILHQFVSAGNTIIYVSHNQWFINEFQGRTVNVELGRILGNKRIEDEKNADSEEREDGGMSV